jgi:hypothetical protein
MSTSIDLADAVKDRIAAYGSDVLPAGSAVERGMLSTVAMTSLTSGSPHIAIRPRRFAPAAMTRGRIVANTITIACVIVMKLDAGDVAPSAETVWGLAEHIGADFAGRTIETPKAVCTEVAQVEEYDPQFLAENHIFAVSVDMDFRAYA